MKTRSNYLGCLCIALVCYTLVCIQCKKKDTDTAVPDQSQRITAAEVYDNDSLTTNVVYSYSGNLLTEIISNYSGQTEKYKTTFQYAGNSLCSSTGYYKKDGSWRKESFTEIGSYSGDNPLEIISHTFDDGIEMYKFKNVYSYDGSRLKQVDEFYSDNGPWTLAGSTNYTYDSTGRIRQVTDTSDIYGHLTTYYYDGDQMTEFVTQAYYNGITMNSAKTTYEYTGGRLSGSANYYWTSNAWSKESENQFEYNELGNLLRVKMLFPGSVYSMRTEVIYGQGTGNFAKCQKVLGMEFFLPGDPTPYPVKAPVSPLRSLFSDESAH